MKVPETSISTIILPEKISPLSCLHLDEKKNLWMGTTSNGLYCLSGDKKDFPNLSQEVISRVFTKIRLKNYGSVPGKKDSTG